MLGSVGIGRRTAARSVGAWAVAGAMLIGAAPTALADPPPDCSAADLAGIRSGVEAATSAYLFSHPDVNDFFSGLRGRPKNQVSGDIRKYLDANPQVKADIQGIRQPLVDLKNRCA